MKFYVYLHRRLSDGSVFYVGKGCGKRAWKKSCRSDWWKRIEAKHGRSVEIIARRLSEEDAFRLEAETVSMYGRENLCNLTDGGEGGKAPSDETRRKMSAAQKGRKRSPETIELKRIVSTGKKHSEETKEKLRALNLGKKTGPRSDETKRKISIAKLGKKFTPEHCAAISAAKKGVSAGPMHENTRAALLKTWTGRKHTEESRRKMAESSTGKRHTPETIAKMTEHNRRNNAARRKPILCSNGMAFEYSGAAEEWLRSSGLPTASRANIVSCCTGKLKSAYGYTWQFADKQAEC